MHHIIVVTYKNESKTYFESTAEELEERIDALKTKSGVKSFEVFTKEKTYTQTLNWSES